jgi:hypothetical protein
METLYLLVGVVGLALLPTILWNLIILILQIKDKLNGNKDE